jgi:hypothetical protein
MNFQLSGTSRHVARTLALCLVLGLLPVLSLGAQPTPVELGLDDLPGTRALHFPTSSTNKATMGTVSADGDYFMSVLDWSSIKNMTNNFFIAGVDEHGLLTGYAHKAGKTYLGVSYSGSLIDELFRRITNQDTLGLRKENTVTSSGGSQSYVSSLLDQDDGTPPGVTVSNNDVNLMLGAGVFGLRLGFAEYIRSVERAVDAPYWSREKGFDSSLKPSLEFGFNFKVGPLRIKPAIRAAFDIHEYNSLKGWLETDGTGTYWLVNEKLINYYEPSAGFSLGFDFANSESASAELILDADASYRLYRTQSDADPISSVWYTGDTLSDPFPTFTDTDPSYLYGMVPDETFNVTIPLDLRIVSAPRFVYTGDISPKLTLGVKVEVGAGFDMLNITQEDSSSGNYEFTITRLSIAPDFSIGASFHLIPDHFSLHAGLGLKLFSFQQTKTEDVVSGDEETKKVIELPSARFAAGLTLNFTEAVAMDLMAVSSGLSVDTTKFTLLLAIKN